VLKAALAFAVIASAETLLCAVAVDTMHTGPRTRFDRELVAQGVGNMTCGALGALPMTGVIVRSAANVEAGARTRLSAILHGVWLLLFVALLPDLLSRIPASALAAILVYTGWKLVSPGGVWKLWKTSKSEALIFVATAATIVAADLLAGVALGVVLSAGKLLWLVSHVSVERQDDPAHHRVHLYLEGAASFIRLPVIAEALDALPAGQKVHIHLDRLRFVDHAVLQLLMTFQKQYEATAGKVFIDWDQLFAHFHGPAAKPGGRERAATPGTNTPGVNGAQKSRTMPTS
jgi:MFS superfamily sulfate permease-like transporter